MLLVEDNMGRKFPAIDDTKLRNVIDNQLGSAMEKAQLHEEIKREAGQGKASENMYRALVESASDGIFILQEQQIRYANKKFCEWTGYSSEELRRLNFLDLIAQGSQSTAASYEAPKAITGDIPNGEIVLVKQDRSKIILDVRGCPIEYQNAPAWQLIARDITEQKHWQEQLHQSEKLTALRQFIAGLAHEINNPLASIYSRIQWYIGRSPDAASAPPALLADIYKETKRATDIMRNLLSFARLSNLEKRPVDMNLFLEKTLAMRARHLNRANITIITELAPTLGWPLIDPLHMQVVFLNIIANAEQAMADSQKGGMLRIIASPRHESPAGFPSGDRIISGGIKSWIQLEFTDNGGGIDPRDLPRIFEPFFTTKSEGHGRGLGLSVAYGIIKDHGGEIYAVSDKGKGTTVVVRLPVTENKTLIRRNEVSLKISQTDSGNGRVAGQASLP